MLLGGISLIELEEWTVFIGVYQVFQTHGMSYCTGRFLDLEKVKGSLNKNNEFQQRELITCH